MVVVLQFDNETDPTRIKFGSSLVGAQYIQQAQI